MARYEDRDRDGGSYQHDRGGGGVGPDRGDRGDRGDREGPYNRGRPLHRSILIGLLTPAALVANAPAQDR
jgi:hypothetical protein